MTIADLSAMQIEANVDETDIGKVKIGQRVSFTIDTYSGQTFTGTVTKISNKSTTTNNVIYYTVYVAVDSNDYDLKPSMTVSSSIRTNAKTYSICRTKPSRQSTVNRPSRYSVAKRRKTFRSVSACRVKNIPRSSAGLPKATK